MRALIHFFFKRHLLANVICVIVFALGIFAALTIRRDLFPPVEFDITLVMATLPGASPEQVEKLLINPMEQKIREVDGLKHVNSNATQGRMVISLQLDSDARDPDDINLDLQRAVDSVDNYPSDADTPVLRVIEAGQTPIIELALYSDQKTELELRDYAKRIADEIETVPGVASVTKNAWRKKEVIVRASEQKMRNYHVAVKDLVDALRRQNLQFPSGDATLPGGREVSVKTDGEFKNLDDVRNTVIRQNFEGYGAKISDVAEVEYQLERPSVLNHTNGKRSVNLVVVKKRNSDALDLVKDIRQKVDQLKKSEQSGVSFALINDFTYYLKNRLEILSTNMIIGVLLVFLVLSLVLPFKVSLIVAFGIPFSLLAQIALANFMGITINLISLVGLIIVCGMIVDDVVVVVENVFRRYESGEELKSAILEGTAEMVRPVFASVATTVAAFSPLMFMTGIMGKFIFEIPVMVIGALFFSLCEGFLIAPVHFLSLFSKEKERPKANDKGKFFVSFLQKYGRLTSWTVDNRYITMLLTFCFLILTGYVAKSHMKFVLFPSDGINVFFMRMESEAGSTLRAMEKFVKSAEESIAKISPTEILGFRTDIGVQQNDPNDPFTKRAPHFAQIRINLTAASGRERSVHEIKKELEDSYQKHAALKNVSFSLAKGGPPQGKPVSIDVIGEDFTELRKIVAKLKAKLKNIKGVHSIRDSEVIGKDEISIVPDSLKMNQANIGVRDISQAVRASFAGEIATSIRGMDENINVRVGVSDSGGGAQKQLEKIRVRNVRGDIIPLKSLATFKQSASQLLISHKKYKRVINISGEVDTEKNTVLDVGKELRPMILEISEKNPGNSVELGGESEDTQEGLVSLGIAFLWASILIFSMLLVTFNSFFQPMLVLLSIPLGLAGASWALFFHGKPFSFMAILGIVALAGVIVNNAIVFLDFFNTRRSQDNNLNQALIDTAVTRARPIILTSITTVCGLMPTAYGIGGSDGIIKPLAISLSWGLAVGAVLTLLVFPAFVGVGEDAQAFLRRLFSRKKAY